MTQRQLAAVLGVSQPQVARWEANAYRTASLSNVGAVARALGVEVELPELLAAEAPSTYTPHGEVEDVTAARALSRLGVAFESIEAFCRLHGIQELSLFGSSVRKDFRPDSDVDVLVMWAEGRRPADIAELLDLQQELSAIFRRRVDLVDRESVESSENYVRRVRILQGARRVYVAR